MKKVTSNERALERMAALEIERDAARADLKKLQFETQRLATGFGIRAALIANALEELRQTMNEGDPGQGLWCAACGQDEYANPRHKPDCWAFRLHLLLVGAT